MTTDAAWDGASRGWFAPASDVGAVANAAPPPPMAWLSDDDLRALGRLSLEHDIDPEWLAIVMWSESGLRPGAVFGHAMNTAPAPLSAGARGLIQFMPDTLRSLFKMADADIVDFPTWQFQGQLVYVSKFISWAESIAKRSLQSQGMIYQAVFGPATLAASSTPDQVIYRSPSLAYTSNRGLDHNGDGAITVGDLDAHLDSLKSGVWPAFVARLRTVTGIAARKPWTSSPRAAGALPGWVAPTLTLGAMACGAVAIVVAREWKGVA